MATGFDSIEPQFVGLFVAPRGAPGTTGSPAMIAAVHVPRLMCQTSFSEPTFDVLIWLRDEYRLPDRSPMCPYQLAPEGALSCASLNAGAGVIATPDDDADAPTTAVAVHTTTAAKAATVIKRVRRMRPSC